MVAVLAVIHRVPPDNLARQAVLLTEQGRLAVIAPLEELAPGDLDEFIVRRLILSKEHGAQEADSPALIAHDPPSPACRHLILFICRWWRGPCRRQP